VIELTLANRECDSQNVRVLLGRCGEDQRRDDDPHGARRLDEQAEIDGDDGAFQFHFL